MAICLVLLILVILWRIFLPRLKGSVGEFKINTKLQFLNEEYDCLSDITIRNSKGSTSQIDHIVISEYGIFVIETKNYKGWIFGNENAENWTQVNYQKKNTFRNPIKQNWSHIYALKDLLSEYPHAQYFPIVVFSGSATLKSIESTVPVIYNTQLIRTIKSLSNERCFSSDEVERIKQIILSNEIQDSGYKREHIQNIRNDIHDREYKERNNICPRCNGTLVLRKGKYGSFYGCSNYPKCKYTKKC